MTTQGAFEPTITGITGRVPGLELGAFGLSTT
jgi:hypothetical protein